MKKSRKTFFKKLAGKAKFAVIATTLAVLPFTGCYRMGEEKKDWEERLRENFILEEDKDLKDALRKHLMTDEEKNPEDEISEFYTRDRYKLSEYGPRKLLYVFPKEVNLSDVPSQYSQYQGTNHFMFKEVLFNSSPKPFKVLYRNVVFNGAELGEVNRRKETDIVKDFGTDVIMPNTEISRDDAFFFAGPELGKVGLKVEYCGYVIDEKTNPHVNYGSVFEFANQQFLTCSNYTLVLGKKNRKVSKTLFDVNWR